MKFMKFILFFLLALIPLECSAQIQNNFLISVVSPVGVACTGFSPAIMLSSTGVIYTCQSSIYASASSGGASSFGQLNDCQPSRTNATTLTVSGCNVNANQIDYIKGSCVITNAAASAFTLYGYITDGHGTDGQAAGVFVLGYSAASGVSATCTGYTVVANISSFPQLCGGYLVFQWTSSTIGQWDVNGYTDFRGRGGGCAAIAGTNMTITTSASGLTFNASGGGTTTLPVYNSVCADNSAGTSTQGSWESTGSGNGIETFFTSPNTGNHCYLYWAFTGAANQYIRYRLGPWDTNITAISIKLIFEMNSATSGNAGWAYRLACLPQGSAANSVNYTLGAQTSSGAVVVPGTVFTTKNVTLSGAAIPTCAALDKMDILLTPDPTVLTPATGNMGLLDAVPYITAAVH